MPNKIKQQARALFFDSGVGGLSIYSAVKAANPSLSVSYLFDNAGFPYGQKSSDVVIQRTEQLIRAVCQRDTIDLIVIACNTASTVVLPTLRRNFTQPVIGVVPAIKPAVALTHNRVIGLLATQATVNRSYTHQLINQFASTCQVELLGSARLVQLAEDKLRGQKIALSEIHDIFAPWYQLSTFPDTVVLGCTHFPLLIDELQAVLPRGTTLIDSGAAIGRRVRSLLEDTHKVSDLYDNKAKNIAYCSAYNTEVESLVTTLNNYGFSELLEQRMPVMPETNNKI